MVGEKLGSFRIEGTLGVGAMGVVYRAVHEPTGRQAAVKVVNNEISNRGKTHERFQREAEILKQFRHPNIVRFYAVGRYKGTSYFAMEFIEGRTLEQRLNDGGPMPWKEVVAMGVQVCDALHYAHEHGVVHRDLKPSNLMVTEEGSVKLTDFGIAKDLDATALTATGRTLGTAAYMAPEQIRGTPEVSHKTDLYALGAVLYQMLTGKLPFEGGSAVVMMHGHLNEPVPRPSAKVAEIPKALDKLVVDLMAKSPDDRPWDAAAAGEALKAIQQKANRGEPLAMVWPTEAAAAAATAASAVVTDGAAKKPPKKGSGKGKARRAGPSAGEGHDRARWLLGTAGLVLALVAIGGFLAYMLWPPGERYLFQHAERLMASENRHDWDDALKEYIEPLDRRFPGHPYRETTRGWRDRILLTAAEGRARVLQSQANTALNKPQNPNEERFVEFYTVASAAEKRGDDLAAIRAWEDWAEQLRPEDKDDRPWQLLARSRADALRRAVASRRQAVVSLLERAQAAHDDGRRQEALGLLTEVKEKYGRYTDLADLLGPAPSETPAPGPAANGAAVAPERPAP